jgi:hypothetical protein
MFKSMEECVYVHARKYTYGCVCAIILINRHDYIHSLCTHLYLRCMKNFLSQNWGKWLSASLHMSVRPSVCSHRTTLLTLDSFSWNLILESFSKICRKNSRLIKVWQINTLNADLNPICHLLVLLGDLTFMGPCIVSIFQYISNKMQRYILYIYLETALHVSGGTSTHHQKSIKLYLQHLVFVRPLLPSAAIVEELELVWMCCRWRTPPTAHSNRFQLFHDSGR